MRAPLFISNGPSVIMFWNGFWACLQLFSILPESLHHRSVAALPYEIVTQCSTANRIPENQRMRPEWRAVGRRVLRAAAVVSDWP